MRTIITTAVLALVLCLASVPTCATAQPPVPEFPNLDGMSAWVRVNGTCKPMQQSAKSRPLVSKQAPEHNCEIRLELPDTPSYEQAGQSVWHTWAVIHTSAWDMPHGRPAHRSFYLSIVQSRNVTLWATQPTSTMRSIKMSTYSFGADGKLDDVRTSVKLELPNGTYLFEHTVPIPLALAHKHGEGGTDMLILMTQLGVKWEYLP